MSVALLGDASLGKLAQQYARWSRSDEELGASEPSSFASFLRQLRSLPRADLPDLAALEAARADVALELPPNPVGLAALAALGPEEFRSSRLQLVCTLRVLVFEHDALALWRGLRAGVPPGPPDAAPTIAVVWRDGADVLHARVDLDEGLALEAALAGDPVARVCAAFGRAEDPVGAAFAALASWFDEGWIAAIVPSPGTVGTAA